MTTNAVDTVLTKLAEIETLKAQAIKELLAQRAEIDKQLAQLGYGDPSAIQRRAKGARVCRTCGESGHNARTCPKKAGG